MKKLIVLLLSMLLVLSLAACGNDAKVEEKKEPTEDVKDEENTDSEDEKEEEEEPEPEAVLVALGEAFVLGDNEITVTEVTRQDLIEVSSMMGYEPKEGQIFYMAKTQVKNLGEEDLKFMPMVYDLNKDVVVELTVTEGDSYESGYMTTYSDDLHNRTIEPDATEEGYLVFELPAETAEDAGITLTFKRGSESVTVTVQ